MKTRILLFAALLLVAFTAVSQDIANKTHIIEIKNMKFVPNELVVQAGDVVVWINKDIVPHNVTEQKTAAWASPLLKPGDSWKMPVAQSADYYCTLHVTMKAKLKVIAKKKL